VRVLLRSGARRQSRPTFRLGARGVTLDEWRDRLGKTAVINVKGNPRQEFKRIREDLQNAKLIGVWEDFVWLA
jgi:hypothetical protein